jgi:hypothetical protein
VRRPAGGQRVRAQRGERIARQWSCGSWAATARLCFDNPAVSRLGVLCRRRADCGPSATVCLCAKGCLRDFAPLRGLPRAFAPYNDVAARLRQAPVPPDVGSGASTPGVGRGREAGFRALALTAAGLAAGRMRECASLASLMALSASRRARVTRSGERRRRKDAQSSSAGGQQPVPAGSCRYGLP